MKRHLSLLALAAFAVVLPLAVPTGHSTEVSGFAAELLKWGKAIDPDGDCQFFVGEKGILISVPGGDRPHDLAADIDVVNAPRILQPAQGDFTVQVQVDGRFAPGGESNQPGRTPYNGAALVAVLDDRNVVTLARAVLHNGRGKARGYANFEIRVDGELLRIGETSDLELPLSGPVQLRIERRRQKILGAVSTDGVTWTELPAKELPEAWPATLQVGVTAISTSKFEFNPRFSNLQLLK